MRCAIIILLCLFFYNTQAQRLVNTNNQFIGGNTFDKYTGLYWFLPEPNGGFVLVGHTSDSASGDVPPNPGRSALMMTRFNSNGQRIGTKIKHHEQGQSSVIRSSDGNLIFLGLIDTAGTDILLYKTDTNLNLLWEKSFGSTSQEWSVNAIEVENKNILCFGLSAGRDRDVPYNHSTAQTFPLTDFVLIKTDSLGNKLWVKVLGTSGDEQIQGKVLTDGQYYYLCVTTKAKDYEFTDSTTYPANGPQYFGNFLVKMDTAGNIVYSRSVGQGFVYNALYDERDSTVIFVGSMTGVVLPPYTRATYGYTDMNIVKARTSDGSVVWANHFGFNYRTIARAISKGPNNSYIMGGERFDLTGGPLFHTPGNDVQLFWVSAMGTLLDSCLIGGTSEEKMVNMWCDGQQVWGIGYTASDYFAPPGGGINPYDSCGNITFLSRFELWPLGVSETPSSPTSFTLSPIPPATA